MQFDLSFTNKGITIGEKLKTDFGAEASFCDDCI